MNWLNFHHLRYFWMVAREGGLRQAAEKLNISQPSISAQIRELEAQEIVLVWQGNRLHRRIWLKHMLAVAVVLAWVCGVCGMSFWLYLLAFVYPGTALMLVRSFAEHRAVENMPERIAIVENAPLMGLLYLNNNLHAVHHDVPNMSWYKIPGYYRQHRAQVLAANGGLVYNGYLDVARRYGLTPHDQPVHPLGRIPARQAGVSADAA